METVKQNIHKEEYGYEKENANAYGSDNDCCIYTSWSTC